MNAVRKAPSRRALLAAVLVISSCASPVPGQESVERSFRDQVLLLEQRRETDKKPFQALWKMADSEKERRLLILALGRVGAPGFSLVLKEWANSLVGPWERVTQRDVGLAVGLLKDESLLAWIAPRVHSSDLARAVALIGALPKDSVDRQAVITALSKDDDQPMTQELAASLNDARTARLIYGARLSGDPFASEVRTVLQESDNREHIHAALYYLGRRPGSPDLSHVPLLAKWLFDKEQRMAAAAARALGRVTGAGEEEAGVLALGLLPDTPPNLMIARLRALAELRCAPPAEAVATAILSDDWRVRRTVFEMLAAQGGRALPVERATWAALSLEAMERDPQVDVRRAAVGALAELDLPTLKEAARKHRLSDPWPVRQAIAEAMGGRLLLSLEGCPPFDEDPDRRVALAWMGALPMAIFGAGEDAAKAAHLWPHLARASTKTADEPWGPRLHRDAVLTSQLALVIEAALKQSAALPGRVNGRWPGIVSFAEAAIAQTPESDVESLLAYVQLAKVLPQDDAKRVWQVLSAKGQPAISWMAQAGAGPDVTSSAAPSATKRSATFVPLSLEQQRRLLLGKKEISVEVETSRGVLLLSLFAEEAPCTVAHFLHLAESGFFDGLLVHRVVPSFVAQIGCPRGDGFGGPGFVLPCEINTRTFRRGTVGMALAGKDTGGSQWFVCHEAMPHLDMRFTVFGELLEGFEVLDALRPQDVVLRVRMK